MATLTISRQELNVLLNQLLAFVNNYSEAIAKEIMLEISFDKMKLKLSVPECTLSSKCETSGKGKFSIQFMYFYSIMKLNEDEIITISYDENKITILQKNFKIIP